VNFDFLFLCQIRILKLSNLSNVCV